VPDPSLLEAYRRECTPDDYREVLGEGSVEGALEWKVLIRFPWDPGKRLFRGERVYVFGLDLPRAETAELSVSV
jgi:hypothetical protein